MSTKITAGMFHQLGARLDQPLLQAEPETMATQPYHLHCLLAFLDPVLGGPPLLWNRTTTRFRRVNLFAMKTNRGKRSAHTMLGLRHRRRAGFQLAGWSRNPMYSTKALLPGLLAGRGSSSTMSHSRLSFAGRRIAYFTPRSSKAWYISTMATAASSRIALAFPIP
jgi:hypothetical protein